MYEVQIGTMWNIVHNKEIVLEVTSKGYADFLCQLLNSGESLKNIANRPHPDIEYLMQARNI